MDCGRGTRGCLFARINFQQIIPALAERGVGSRLIQIQKSKRKGIILKLHRFSFRDILILRIVPDSLTQYFDVAFLVLDNFVQSACLQVYFIMVFAGGWQIRRGLGFFRFYFRLFSFNAVLSLCFSCLKQKQ